MLGILNEVWVTGTAILVAMNIVTTGPMYVSITEDVEQKQRAALVRSAVLLAAVVAILMTIVGSDMLRFMGVTLADLRIGGGIVLLGLGFHDLVLSRGERKVVSADDIGAVPIGVPLLVGPATMTTLIVASEEHGRLVTMLALLPNLVAAFVVLHYAHRIVPLIGKAGSRAMGKLMSLMLMAIGVAMARTGLQSLFL